MTSFIHPVFYALALPSSFPVKSFNAASDLVDGGTDALGADIIQDG